MRRITVKLAQILLAGGTLLGLSTPRGVEPARADAVSYSAQRRLIKACVLVSNATANFNANGGPNNPVPYLFFALDSSTNYKPGGWTFVNPLAPSNITQAIYNRWKARGAGNTDPAFNNARPESQVFQIGSALNKNIGAYWEVNLDTVSDSDLHQFDVVFMPLQGGRPNSLGGANNRVVFDAVELEKLRHYVDNGGTIWVENDGSSNFNNGASQTGQFIVNMNLGAGVSGPTLIEAPFHPVVNYPYTISPAEVLTLGQAIGTGADIAFSDANSSAGGRIAPRILTPILNNNGATFVYAGDYGAGHLVISGLNIAADINAFLATGGNYGGTNNVAGGSNDAAISGTDFAAIPPTDLKFAFNVIDWISSVPVPGANAHRSGSSTENVGNVLAPKWNGIPGLTDPGNVGAGAVISRGAAFNISGAMINGSEVSNVLQAYAVNPGQSLNGLLQIDNGLQDFSLGYPYDQIWTAQLPGNPARVRYSTPSLYSVYSTTPNSNDGGDHVVAVTTNTVGQTFVYNAFPRDNQGRLAGAAAQIFQFPGGNPPNSAGNTGINSPRAFNILPAPASAYSEGVLFVPYYNVGLSGDTDHAWHIQAIDLQASVDAQSTIDAFPGGGGIIPTTNSGFNPVVPGLPDISGPLSVGYVKDNGTGAIDQVVYAATQGANANNSHNSQVYQGQVTGLWFRTRNEPLQPTDPVSNGVNLRFQPHFDRSWVPWYVPTSLPGSAQLDLVPVVHVISRNTITGQIVSTADYKYSPNSTVFSISFGANTPPDSPRAQATQRFMEIDFVPGQGIPVAANGIAYSVSVDYVVDWPGAAIGGATLTGADMLLIASHRSYVLFPGVGGGQIGGGNQVHYTIGGPALSSDSLLFATQPNNPSTNDGLSDAIAGAPLPDRIYSVQDQYSAQIQTAAGLTSAGPITNWMWAPTYSENFNGQQISSRLVNNDSFGSGNSTGQVVDGKSSFHIVGQPVVANGVIYVVAHAQMSGSPGFPATIILALSAQPTNSVSFPTPFTYTLPGTVRPNRLVVQQPDLIRSTAESPVYLQLFPGTNYTLNLDTDATGNQIIRGITIINARSAQGQDAFNAALPIWITDSSSVAQVIRNPTTGYGPLDNLLWYLIIPEQAGLPPSNGGITVSSPNLVNIGQAASGASVFGQTLYYNSFVQHQPTQTNPGTFIARIVTVDLNGAASDGHLFAKDGTPRVHVLNTMTDPRDGTPFASFYPAINPPSATANTVALGQGEGMVALDNQLTLVADNNRLLEIDAFGGPIWSLDATTESSVVGGQFGGSGAVANTHVPFDRPALARLVSPNIFLVADTGNNRIVQCDLGGKVTNEIHTVNNNMSILRPGDPLTLNAPTDVQTYVNSSNNSNAQIQLASPLTGATYTYTGPYYATHYLIADSGNYRAIEVVDAINTNTGQPVVLTSNNANYPNVTLSRQIIFVTSSLAEQNSHLRFQTIQQFLDYDGSIKMVAAISNVRQPQVVGAAVQGFGSDGSQQTGPGGSLMIMSRAYGSTTLDGAVLQTLNSITFRSADGNTVLRRQAVNNPTWFKEFYAQDPNSPSSSPTPHYLLSDATGCYVLAPNASTSELDVQWALTNEDYYWLTGRRLQAASITRLTQADLYTDVNGRLQFAPHYLITNSYTGTDNIVTSGLTDPAVFPGASRANNGNVAQGEVHGEVFEIRGRDYYDQPGSQVPAIDRTAGSPNFSAYNGYSPAYINGIPSGTAYSTNQLYLVISVLNGSLLVLNTQSANSAGSCIVSMLPAETITGTVINPLPITRTIGGGNSGTTSYTLQQPKFSDRP